MESVDIAAILSQLSREEKISLLAGANFWETTSIPDKNIPALKFTDGPNGARGTHFNGSVTAACLPAACSVAATFDTESARRVGVILGQEALTKGARCILGPTMCIHRHPLGGRNFESYSEDPWLSGTLATAAVQGLESTGVSASIKHFVANEQETNRLTVDARISPRTLREVYLKPFEMVVKQANPGAVMTSYNLVNGTHPDSDPFLVDTILRREWGFQGLVMSDWGGVNSVAGALNAGLDLEMPGPPRWRKPEDVLKLVTQTGEVSDETIDARAISVLRFLHRQNCFQDPVGLREERAIDEPEHRKIIREAGAKGIVLLKNEGDILPLTRSKMKDKKVALLGYAHECLGHGGGSAALHSHYKVSPWDALHNALGESVEFVFAKGAHTFRQLPLLTSRQVIGLDGEPGFSRRLYALNSSGPVHFEHGHASSEFSMLDGSEIENKAVQLTGTFTPSKTDKFYIALSGLGPSELSIDGETLYKQDKKCRDTMAFLFGGVEVPLVEVNLEAGRGYKLDIRSDPIMSRPGDEFELFESRVSIRVGIMSAAEHDADIMSEAVALAETADYAIIFTGHDPAWETEGQDQKSFHLPKDGSQDRLVTSVSQVNPNTIVVNSTGVAVAMPWLGQIKGLLQAWFPGQEAGNSIADVLTGVQTPEGHLPCTFPKELEDCPAYGNFPGDVVGKDFRVHYQEGMFIGYRHFDRLPHDALNFPFGFGLSYTTFAYADFTVQRETGGSDCIASVCVSNIGSVKGATAVQIYASQPNADKLGHPVKILVGVQKVTLAPGERRELQVVVRGRELAFWEEAQRSWVVEGGSYVFSVCRNAAEIVSSIKLDVPGTTYHP